MRKPRLLKNTKCSQYHVFIIQIQPEIYLKCRGLINENNQLRIKLYCHPSWNLPLIKNFSSRHLSILPYNGLRLMRFRFENEIFVILLLRRNSFYLSQQIDYEACN